MKKIALLSALLMLSACASSTTTTVPSGTTATSDSKISITPSGSPTTGISASTQATYSTDNTAAMPANLKPLSAAENQAEFDKVVKALNITSLKDCERVPANMTTLCTEKFAPASTEPTPTPRPPMTAPAAGTASADTTTTATTTK